MSFSEFMQPFVTLLNWSRSFQIHLGGVTFTFFEMWTYTIVAAIVVAFIKWVFFD